VIVPSVRDIFAAPEMRKMRILKWSGKILNSNHSELIKLILLGHGCSERAKSCKLFVVNTFNPIHVHMGQLAVIRIHLKEI